MRKWITIVAIVVAVMVASYGVLKHYPIYQATTSTETVTIDNTIFTVDVARTTAQQARGLSGRTSLASNSGMLFPFNPPQQPQFWMIKMNFPLDFVWIDKGQIVDITRKVPAPLPNTPTNQLPLYSPKTVVNNVLEINAGASNNFKIGDKVTISNNSNL